MKRFLIEVPHGADKNACNQAIQVFLETGSHFLTHADWGCHDGEHKAWIIVEVENKEQARLILPSFFRHSAKIIELTTFTNKDLMETDQYHQG
jgi:hypothetical protein